MVGNWLCSYNDDNTVINKNHLLISSCKWFQKKKWLKDGLDFIASVESSSKLMTKHLENNNFIMSELIKNDGDNKNAFTNYHRRPDHICGCAINYIQRPINGMNHSDRQNQYFFYWKSINVEKQNGLLHRN